jgi:glyoxylase-like metal-dependent hydrolase (beta-lactamase superfamily II)
MTVHDLDAMTMRPIGLSGRDATVDAKGRRYLVTRMLLVNDPECGWVAIDAGIGDADTQQPARRLGVTFKLSVGAEIDRSRTLMAQCRRLGIDPTDVKHIVCTHLDVDHAGGLPDFPHARVHVNPRELHAAQFPKGAVQKGRYRPVHFAHGPEWVPFGEADSVWHGFDSGPIPGLPSTWRWVDLSGHTPGHSGILVETPEATIFHLGDAFLQLYELKTHKAPESLAVKFHHAFFDTDPELAAARRVALRRVYQSFVTAGPSTRRVRWYSGHDPSVPETGTGTGG